MSKRSIMQYAICNMQYAMMIVAGFEILELVYARTGPCAAAVNTYVEDKVLGLECNGGKRRRA
jgi:hypothetical protein